VRDHQRADYLQLIEDVHARLTEIRNFAAEEGRLSCVEDEIEQSQKQQVEEVRTRLVAEAEHIKEESTAYQRIGNAIQTGDVATANELIDLTLHGDTLPDVPDLPDNFQNFYPRNSALIDEFLNNPANQNQLSTLIRNQRSIPGLDMRQVPGAQIGSAIDMLDAWMALKRTKRPSKDQLQILFQRLGFNAQNISESNAMGRAVITMDTASLTHRAECPIPHFGSKANGHYRVFCIWDRPSDEEILTFVRQNRGTAPAIVLFFGRLTEHKRRSIATLVRNDSLNFLLIDELLITYLCGERGSRLPVMFDCALPFTFQNPYVTTGSNVPPEMFYGRRWEREQITDTHGSCFVYGGRQLGKTALLMSIRDEFHAPADQRIALYIDLLSFTDDIWVMLSRTFRNLQDVDIQIGDARSAGKLSDRLKAWLLADDRRRILLMLDEADRFLEADSADGFRRTSALKGIMEATNRRFKVVFAGLHNVQRTTRQENHPLAHFGEPICIGPLLDRGEWKEAKALIEKPFWSLGFRFDNLDLVTRILSRTNYYPSLIQLYCNQIHHSVKLDNSTLRGGPPYVITTKHVEDAYLSRQYKDAIQDKFDLTLNLDLRYKALALIIARNSSLGSSKSMTVKAIREEAFSWWKLGFEQSRTEEDFRILLDEMIGLGILREKDNQFALRTPNLLSLLGREEQVDTKLIELSYSAAPQPYTAQVAHNSDPKCNYWRNPLTEQQDGELRAERNAVTLIYATKAAGLDDLEHFLAQSFESSHFERCQIVSADRIEFRKYLEHVRGKIAAGTTLIFVRQSPWTYAWIEEALSLSKTKTRFTSIVFVADPEAAWRLIPDRSILESQITSRRLNAISLQPWHPHFLSRWLGDCSIGSNGADEAKVIGALTGSWPLILEEFRAAINAETKPWKEALRTVASRIDSSDSNQRYQEAFGLNVPIPHKVLSEMAGYGGTMNVDDLAELLDSMTKQQVDEVIYWGDRLGLVQPAAGGEWALDDVAQKVLTAGTKKTNELVVTAGTE
jgi:hypothetical protein